jgi:hypothetical protein
VDDIFVLLSPWSSGLVLALLWSQLSKNRSEKKYTEEISSGLIPRARWQGDASQALGNSGVAAKLAAIEVDQPNSLRDRL